MSTAEEFPTMLLILKLVIQMRRQKCGNVFSALLPFARTVLLPIIKTLGLSAISGAALLSDHITLGFIEVTRDLP